MQIKHIEKTTVIDYPDHIASIVFVGGCNFRCDYCYNKDLVLNPDRIDNISVEDTLVFLEKRKKYIEGVVVTGGEPTLYEGCRDFFYKIKEMGLLVKLDTNGLRPIFLKELIDLKLLDYIAMDIKAPLKNYGEVSGVDIDIEKIRESMDIIKFCGVDSEFRTTVWQGYFLKYSIDGMLDLIKDAKNYYLHNFFAVGEDSSKKYLPATKSEVVDFTKKAKEIVGKFGFRGDWL
jgi:pyruvate formate lyase activating enzyme